MQSDLDAVREAYEQTGSVNGAARLLGWTRKKARYWSQKLFESLKEDNSSSQEVGEGEMNFEYKGQRIKTIEQLLSSSEVNLNEWSITDYTVNAWEAITRDGTIQTLYQVKAHLYKNQKFDQAVFVPPKYEKFEGQVRQRSGLCLVIPDTQHGFTKNQSTGELTPFHDSVAWNCMLDSAKRRRPTEVILLGDHLDLNEWSTKYSRGPEHAFTTNAAIQTLHEDLSRLRAAVGEECRIRYIEGNHERRFQTLLQDRVPQLCALTGLTSDESVLSVPKLLHLDKLGIEYVSPYGTQTWLWDEIRFHHGDIVRQKGGATVSAILENADFSEVFGHIHRCEIAYKTVHGPNGPDREIFVMTPGTLARIDGAVPPGGRPNWQQGFAYITRDNNGLMWPEMIRIRNGGYFE